MKQATSRRCRAFTLLELTVVMLIGMMTGAMMLSIFNQQVAFLQIYRVQSFLTEEAPIVSTYLSRLISKADRFRLHDSVSDALAGTNPRTSSAPVCLLNFTESDGTVRAAILAFEDLGEGRALYYYVVPQSGALADPEWAVTKKLTNIEFFMDQGILRARLTGPQGEQIIYSGAMQ